MKLTEISARLSANQSGSYDPYQESQQFLLLEELARRISIDTRNDSNSSVCDMANLIRSACGDMWRSREHAPGPTENIDGNNDSNSSGTHGDIESTGHSRRRSLSSTTANSTD